MMPNREEMLECLRQVVAVTGLKISTEQYRLFGDYYELMLEHNQRVNLTRITEPVDVAIKHFGDSLALLSAISFQTGSAIADVGTGAGFPGLPIAILRPDLQVTLIDSLRKRTAFLTEVVQRLKLVNVRVVWGRAEDLGRKALFREQFNVVMARAVAPLNVLSELCLPLLERGGLFVAMKGPKAEEEIIQATVAIRRLGGVLLGSETQNLPLVNEKRCLIRIAKQMTTPQLYPRKAGIPERDPLS